MTSLKTRPGFLADGVTVVQFVVTQGIHPDESFISDAVGDLLHVGDLMCQFAYSLGNLASCIRQISIEHDGCTIEDCETCAALFSAITTIHAFDIVNGTALWANGGACEHAH